MGNIMLYHGSNIEINKVDLQKSRITTDFGKAFYLTTSLDQAQKWANKIAKIKSGNPIVSIFEYQENNTLNNKIFNNANYQWLDYVVLNRLGNNINDIYDIVVGPVANDNTMPVILDYMASSMNDNEKEAAILRLKAFILINQYAFKTEHSLEYLKFKGVQNG